MYVRVLLTVLNEQVCTTASCTLLRCALASRAGDRPCWGRVPALFLPSLLPRLFRTKTDNCLRGASRQGSLTHRLLRGSFPNTGHRVAPMCAFHVPRYGISKCILLCSHHGADDPLLTLAGVGQRRHKLWLTCSASALSGDFYRVLLHRTPFKVSYSPNIVVDLEGPGCHDVTVTLLMSTIFMKPESSCLMASS